MTLAKRIQAARKAAGLTQAALAELCGYDPPSRLANYEQGIREPSLADLRLIASKVEAGGYTYGRIVLDDAELSQAVSITPEIVTAAVALARKAIGLTGDDSFDPATDPEVFAHALKAAIAASLRMTKGGEHGSAGGTGKVGGSRSAKGAAKDGEKGKSAAHRQRKSA